MKCTIIFVLISLLCLVARAQTDIEAPLVDTGLVDTTLAKKITLGDFCLCRLTLTDLHNLDKDLQKVPVEEMDRCGSRFVQDGRFKNGEGYASKKYPGIIFQKDKETDLISKIRLTKEFVGNLPDGMPVDMRTLRAKDVIKLYPAYKPWQSRDCSDYWNISNDTLCFFVKINRLKAPQYPVDEAYYRERPVEGIDLVISCYDLQKKAERRAEPIMFLDSVKITTDELAEHYEPDEMAAITVYKDTNAIKLIGPDGRNGVVYLETKKFVRIRYWKLFSTRSADYKKAVPSPESDSTVAYILNGKVLTETLEGTLSTINEKTLLDLKVIDKKTLASDYGVTDKVVGIVIKAERQEIHGDSRSL